MGDERKGGGRGKRERRLRHDRQDFGEEKPTTSFVVISLRQADFLLSECPGKPLVFLPSSSNN